jgi:phosphoribosylaminoimidazolecarboxamide formyltransferase/IMP cyclohydrolase
MSSKGQSPHVRALISVYDKTGIVDFARRLVDLDWEILSTGGTMRTLEEAGVPVTAVADVTGFPEILDGRVKTLHPAIHGGLLARLEDPAHREQLADHDIQPIGMLVSNLYPFEQTVLKISINDREAIEQIDIGGPAMIRAAAKNHEFVIVLVDPADQQRVLEALNGGDVEHYLRRKLAAKAFQHTAEYDTLVSAYLRSDSERFPSDLTIAGRKSLDLRYGENPHQAAAAYFRLAPGGAPRGVLAAEKLQGKEISYNNLLDANAAWSAVQGWERPAVSIVKHMIPCGLAVRDTLPDAYEAALAGDPVSAFGGIVALNRPVDGATAVFLKSTFFEVILAPAFDDEARKQLRSKKNLRLLEMRPTDLEPDLSLEFRSIQGALLVQQPDLEPDHPSTWLVVTDRAPTDAEMRDLRFAWRAVRHVKSNAIVLARDEAIAGVGAGQPNRVESVNIAIRKAGERAAGAVLASDAYFPFADGLEAAIAAGVTAAIQPGGSIRDEEVLAAANGAGIAMIFTGIRHFLH